MAARAQPIATLDIATLRKQDWRQDMSLNLAGFENSVAVLVSARAKRYLLLLDVDAYPQLSETDLLDRFDTSVEMAMRLTCAGLYVGRMDEILLAQSHLQQHDAVDVQDDTKRTGAHRNFDLVVTRAVEAGASDIHFEFRDGRSVEVKFRIHGRLRAGATRDRLMRDYQAMLDAVSASYNSRADTSSRSHNHFDAAAHQSCSIPLSIKARQYQLRYQSIKENRGFDVVLRLLLNEAIESDVQSLAELGYSEDQIETLEYAVHRSPGLTMIAGETGSGKSTTLRTLMTYERGIGKKFYSIEDPVEYIQPHMTQIPIQRKAEGSAEGESAFGAAAKVILRGDPDKIMPGEVRDPETGSFAKSMTETGHQVLSTIHASSCFGILARLASGEIGLPLSALSAPNFLTALIYQKLLPVLCPQCCLPAEDVLDTELLQVIAELGLDVKQINAEGPGCVHCQSLGTVGQTVVAEVCEVTEDMLPLIREARFWELERRWAAHNTHALDSPTMLGKTVMEHAIYKMSLGRIDPRDVESAFYKLKKYRDRSVTTRSLRHLQSRLAPKLPSHPDQSLPLQPRPLIQAAGRDSVNEEHHA